MGYGGPGHASPFRRSRVLANRSAGGPGPGTALEGLGHHLQHSIDPGNNTAHRFVRGVTAVDVVADCQEEQADVVIADHAAARVVEKLRGRDMVRTEGGTQALRRTVNARLQIEGEELSTVSVPRPFGALILKAAAYITDSRDRDRHLFDAAALLACIDDPCVEREGFTGSDRGRIAMWFRTSTSFIRHGGCSPSRTACRHRSRPTFLPREMPAHSRSSSSSRSRNAGATDTRHRTSTFASARPGPPLMTLTCLPCCCASSTSR